MAELDLLLDVLGEVVAILVAHAAGIDQLEIAAGSTHIRYVSRSRVTPAVSSTMARRLPTSQLNRLDLPTFGRPTITTFATPMTTTLDFYSA